MCHFVEHHYCLSFSLSQVTRGGPLRRLILSVMRHQVKIIPVYLRILLTRNPISSTIEGCGKKSGYWIKALMD